MEQESANKKGISGGTKIALVVAAFVLVAVVVIPTTVVLTSRSSSSNESTTSNAPLETVPKPSPTQGPPSLTGSNPTIAPQPPTGPTPSVYFPQSTILPTATNSPPDLSACLQPEKTTPHYWQDFLTTINATTDSWCRPGSEEPCECYHPLQPRARTGSLNRRKEWNQTRARNVEQFALYPNAPLALIGDSITEHWLGTSVLEDRSKYDSVEEAYVQVLTRAGGGLLDAVVLGVAGDKTWNVHYRVRQGELGDPDATKIQVYWLLIGTNDWGRDCLNENIVAGNIAIIEYIVSQRPEAMVVVNSLLPRGEAPLDVSDSWAAFTDINHQLACYAESQPNVVFFNATDIFVTDNAVNIDHMPDHLHPNGAGSLIWGKAIVDTVLPLLSR